ncbi:hypothetical protein TREES_T100004522 [Tupaia chinensis]|uniref:Uncharacterized protein n=1 Tax=Tupaia chinensis TaxID=246437 RepID=L9JWP0_TUPCH|nr:hypothetical protein TREES_T100004522 [Tupaia chinensis]
MVASAVSSAPVGTAQGVEEAEAPRETSSTAGLAREACTSGVQAEVRGRQRKGIHREWKECREKRSSELTAPRLKLSTDYSWNSATSRCCLFDEASMLGSRRLHRHMAAKKASYFPSSLKAMFSLGRVRDRRDPRGLADSSPGSLSVEAELGGLQCPYPDDRSYSLIRHVLRIRVAYLKIPMQWRLRNSQKLEFCLEESRHENAVTAQARLCHRVTPPCGRQSPQLSATGYNASVRC